MNWVLQHADSWMRRALDHLFNLVFLDACRMCGAPTAARTGSSERTGKALCAGCLSEILRATPVFEECLLGSGQYITIASGARYRGDLKRLLYKLKYDDDRLLAYDLAQLLAAAWTQIKPMVRDGSVILVPVPLHPAKLRRRGFNQAALLAQCVGEILSMPVASAALVRVKDTRPQHGLGREQRCLNMKGAFRSGPVLVRGAVVILVDDIYTSGATLAEAADEVVANGAAAVFGLTVARAVLTKTTRKRK